MLALLLLVALFLPDAYLLFVLLVELPPNEKGCNCHQALFMSYAPMSLPDCSLGPQLTPVVRDVREETLPMDLEPVPLLIHMQEEL